MEVPVAGEPELPATVIDFGAPVVIDPEIVALRDRFVQPDFRPLGRALVGRVVQGPLNIGDPPNPIPKWSPV